MYWYSIVYQYTHAIIEYTSRGYIIKISLFDIQQTFTISSHLSLVNLVQLLYNHGTSSTAAVANSGDTILTGLQLMKQCDQNARARATQSMSNGDGTSKKVDLGVLQAENLRLF